MKRGGVWSKRLGCRCWRLRLTLLEEALSRDMFKAFHVLAMTNLLLTHRDQIDRGRFKSPARRDHHNFSFLVTHDGSVTLLQVASYKPSIYPVSPRLGAQSRLSHPPFVL
jgi:hypothetical protein